MKALILNKHTKKFKAYTGPYKYTRLLRGTIALILLMGVALSGCKKSLTNGIVFAVGTSNFKYTALVRVRDASNTNIAPGNLTVSVAGPNANLVYDLTTGKRKLTINPDGTIQLLISPNQSVVANLNFNLSVTSPGYLPAAKSITITPADSTQVITIGLRTASATATGGNIPGVAQFGLVNGALAHQSIVKINSDNSIHAISGLDEPINNADNRRLSATGDGSTPAKDVTYYDDGLTSIVLPQGTTFHYWELKPTGVIITDTEEVAHVTAVASATISGIATGTVTEYKTYYTQEIFTYPQTSWVEESLSAAASNSDSVAVVVNYSSGSDVTTKVEFGYQGVAPTIHTTISNKNVLQDELLFKTVVSERLNGNPVFYKIHHANTKTWYDYSTGKQYVNQPVAPYIVYDQLVYPDETANWFTSFAVNSQIINPNTNEPIKAGDLVEIGIDSANNTVTQAVEQVANGQLRVQMLSYDAGFFYQAPYVSAFDYTINPVTNVADPENTIGYISILGGYFQFGFYGGYNSGAYIIQGKIASATQINTKTTAVGYYWGQNVFTGNYGLNATINPFNFSPPYPTVKFSIYATQNDPDVKNIEVDAQQNPNKNYTAVTLYTGFTSNYGSGIVNINNGYWATNNLPVGATISGSSYVDGFLINLNSYQITNANPNGMYWDSPKWQ